VGSAQATETKKPDQPQDMDDFDPAGDICDFGFVLAPLPIPGPAAETRPNSR
jgi:hypothetical protein